MTPRTATTVGLLTAMVGLTLNACVTVADDRGRPPGPVVQRPVVVQQPVVVQRPPVVVVERGREEAGWELLGRREVDFKADRDTIEVGQNEGRFRRLRVVVRGAPIELHDLKVVLGDNSVLDPKLRHHFAENTALELDLPGDRRFIRRITFLYRSIGGRREGRATVLVYGRH